MASPVHGSTASVFGLSSRSSSMAGAMTAIVDDHTAAYYNPGALGFVLDENEWIQSGAGIIHTTRDFEVSDTSGASVKKEKDTTGVSLGFTMDLKRMYDFLGGVNLGVSVYMPRDKLLIITVPKSAEKNYFFPLYDDEGGIMGMYSALAFKANEKISIGIGAAALMDLPHTNSDIDAQIAFSDLVAGGLVPVVLDAIATGGTVDLTDYISPSVAVNREMHTKAVPYAGVTIDALDGLTIGMSFRNRLGALAYGVQPTQIMDESGNVLFSMNIPVAYYVAFSPREYSLGIGINRGSVLADLDVTYAMWSGYRGPHFERPTHRFKDTWNPKIGVEYRLAEKISLRGGYAYRPTPAPEQTGSTNYLDADTHIFCGGLAYRIGSGTLESHFQYHKWKDQKVDKEGGLPDLMYGGSLWNVGLSYTVTFQGKKQEEEWDFEGQE